MTAAPTCRVSGKVCYRTPLDAHSCRFRIQQNRAAKAYFCKHCKSWHLASNHSYRKKGKRK